MAQDVGWPERQLELNNYYIENKQQFILFKRMFFLDYHSFGNRTGYFIEAKCLRSFDFSHEDSLWNRS
jgi:hypothetical protein